MNRHADIGLVVIAGEDPLAGLTLPALALAVSAGIVGGFSVAIGAFLAQHFVLERKRR